MQPIIHACAASTTNRRTTTNPHGRRDRRWPVASLCHWPVASRANMALGADGSTSLSSL